MNKSFSLSSLQLNLQCIKCHHKPNQQFLLLLCDHVVCIDCIDSHEDIKKPGFDGVKCPCGLTTFFKSLQTKDFSKISTRPSVGLIQSRKINHSQANKFGSRVQTQFIPVDEDDDEEERERVQTSYTLERSNYPIADKKYHHTLTDISDSFQQKQCSRRQKYSPHYLRSPEKSYNNNNSINKIDNSQDFSISGELCLELDNLKARHQQLMSSLERAYKKAVLCIQQSFDALENRLKDLCLEKIVLDTPNSQVDFSKIIKLKYDHEICHKIEQITETLKNFTNNNYALGVQTSKIPKSCARDKQPSLSLEPSKKPTQEAAVINIYTKGGKGTQIREQFELCRHNQVKKLQKKGLRRKNVIIEI